ncbi:Cell wall assembly regulator [Toensbergia leucococca]|nr:Cell wall assembly regulator [Toensbergia leucococca]
MTSNDRHASHDSPYRTGQHMPLNQSRHAPLTSIATSALDSRPDLNSPYIEDGSRRPIAGLQNGNAGWSNSPGGFQSPNSPYSPGMRSNLALQRTQSNDHNPMDTISPGEIQMQSFQEGLPPPPPVSHSWKRIERWVEDNYQELYDQLSEGCTQNDVNELEHELDCSLPMEVRESLQVHDGQERGGRPTGIIFGCMLLDCEEIVQEWKNWRVVSEEYLTAPVHYKITNPLKVFGGASSSSVAIPSMQQGTNPLWRQELLDRQDSQPSRAIQKAYVHSGWIPLARDWGGNNIAVDLAPGPVGKWGQVIIFGRDYDCKYVIARSWSAFLAMVADDIGSEKVFVDEETQELKLREFKAAGVEPAYLDILRWRMDQKYGRKGPKRKPGNFTGGTANVRSRSNHGSPYGSPTEDRGRSPQRFSTRGPSSSSPRGNISSPLAKVSEETPAPISIHTGGDANRETVARDFPASERDTTLVEIISPVFNDENMLRKNIGAVTDASVLSDSGDQINKKPPKVKGLGVEGMEEMKSVDI